MAAQEHEQIAAEEDRPAGEPEPELVAETTYELTVTHGQTGQEHKVCEPQIHVSHWQTTH